MAARLNAQHQDRIRALIQANRIVVRLNAFVLGRKFQGQEVKMTPDQIRAAGILLNKRLPDLQAVQLTGDPDAPVTVEHRMGGRAADLIAKVKGGTAARAPGG